MEFTDKDQLELCVTYLRIAVRMLRSGNLSSEQLSEIADLVDNAIDEMPEL